MKILYIHRTAGTRVEGVHIRELVKGFESLGHEVSVFSPPGCDPLKEEATDVPESGAQQCSGLGGFVRQLPRCMPPLFFELLELLYSLASLPFLAIRVARFRPTFIYERTSTFQFAATLVGRCSGTPVIQEVNQTATIGRVRKVILKRTSRMLERWVFRRAAALVTISSRFRELLMDEGTAGDKIFVVPNAADPERFGPHVVRAVELEPCADGAVVLGYVGAFLPWHKLDRFLDLLDSMPSVSLLLIGDGPERSRLQQQAQQMEIGQQVRFTGALPHDRLPSYVQHFDVAVMASATDYASPVKMFEYMAMGKAIVAPDVPPVREILTDGEHAVFFEPDDIGSLENAVSRIVSDRPLRERLGRSARALLVEQHTWLQNAERVVEIVKQHDGQRVQREPLPHREKGHTTSESGTSAESDLATGAISCNAPGPSGLPKPDTAGDGARLPR